MVEEKDRYERKEINDDSLDSILYEQARKQVRSDYRRSLGNEHRRRHME
jgi:hypothetical protein